MPVKKLFSLSRKSRIKIVIASTACMLVGELVFGYITKSMALVTDAFHMLSDLMALCIAHKAITLAESKNYGSQQTYGWQRAETIGALINSVFLLALCFTVFLKAIERFIDPVRITQPMTVLIIGCIGLTVNIFSLILFHDHGESEKHPLKISDEIPTTLEQQLEDASHPELQEQMEVTAEAAETVESIELAETEPIPAAQLPSLAELPHHHVVIPVTADRKTVQVVKAGSLNMKAAFLHVMGDALGSVGVIISAATIQWSNWSSSYYLDPAVSVLIAGIIICTTWRLFRRTCDILLHVVPSNISIQDIRRDIMNLSDVHDLHELHVWQLSDLKTVASVHVIVNEPTDDPSVSYMKISNLIKRILHVHKIHNTTVQLETRKDGSTASSPDDDRMRNCLVPCDETECGRVTCCPNGGGQ